MMKNLKNVVLDFGGVLYDIDPEKTYEKLKDLFLPEIKDNLDLDLAYEMVFGMETGKWSEEVFFKRLKDVCRPEVTEEEILNAWCAILLQFPKERIQMVKTLSEQYRVFLLSNTNSIHINYFETEFLQNNGYSMHELFDKIYYSSEIGFRKPDSKAFQHVLDKSGLIAQETVMVDDMVNNCLAAESIGMKSIRVPEKTGLEEVIHLLIS